MGKNQSLSLTLRKKCLMHTRLIIKKPKKVRSEVSFGTRVVL